MTNKKIRILLADDQELIRRTLRTVIESKNEFGIEYRVLGPGGSFHWILSRGRFQGSRAGRPDRLMGVSVDITARREAEEALREAETTLKAIIDSTADMIWSVDPNSFGLMTFNAGLFDYFLEKRGIRLERGMRDGKSISVWEEAHPAKYLSLSAGTYVVTERKAGDLPLYAYFSPGNASLAASYLDASADYIRLYEGLFGPYPFEKFAIVENFIRSAIAPTINTERIRNLFDRSRKTPSLRGRNCLASRVPI